MYSVCRWATVFGAMFNETLPKKVVNQWFHTFYLPKRFNSGIDDVQAASDTGLESELPSKNGTIRKPEVALK